MGAPAEFLVARHLLSHPADGPGEVARHVRLHRPVVANAIRRLRQREIVLEPHLLHFIAHHPRRVHHRAYRFRAPNPRQWLNAMEAPFLLSGDVVAAEHDGYNVVPDQWIAYVRPEDESAALEAAKKVFADVAPREKANLIVKVMDAWLRPDAEDPRIVERGQRLLDYQDSPLLQIVAAIR